MMASAIAQKINMPFIELNVSTLYLTSFKTIIKSIVKNYGSCVIFIDESSSLLDHYSAEILKILDGLNSQNKVLFICADNKSKLSPALIRSGRIDHVINFVLPDMKDRVTHFTKIYPDINPVIINKFADLTHNFSHSDINIIPRQLLMIDDDKSLEHKITSIIYNMKTTRNTSDDYNNTLVDEKDRLRVAYHEIGHLLLSYLLPIHNKPVMVTIKKRSVGSLKKFKDNISLFDSSTDVYGEVEINNEKNIMTSDDYYYMIIISLASTVFEEYYMGAYSNLCEHDLSLIKSFFDKMVELDYIDESDGLRSHKNKNRKVFIKKAKDQISKLITKYSDTIEKIKNLLLENDTLYTREILDCIPESMTDSDLADFKFWTQKK